MTDSNTLRVGTSFLELVSSRLRETFEEVLEGKPSGLFRRSPKVLLGSGNKDSSNVFQLVLTDQQISETRRDSLEEFDEQANCYRVYRMPTKMKLAYSLQANGISLEKKFDAYERLNAYFFDNPSIESFIPDSFRVYPKLYDFLGRQRASLTTVPTDGTAALKSDFFFPFEYTALYHSGSCMRKDKRIAKRVVDYRNH